MISQISRVRLIQWFESLVYNPDSNKKIRGKHRGVRWSLTAIEVDEEHLVTYYTYTMVDPDGYTWGVRSTVVHGNYYVHKDNMQKQIDLSLMFREIGRNGVLNVP